MREYLIGQEEARSTIEVQVKDIDVSYDVVQNRFTALRTAIPVHIRNDFRAAQRCIDEARTYLLANSVASCMCLVEEAIRRKCSALDRSLAWIEGYEAGRRERC